MRRLLAVIIPFALLLAPLHAAPADAAPAGIGKTQILEGFAATPVAVLRAREAGAADYVAGRGNIFVLITLQLRRQGSHQSFLADPADFHVQTSKGVVIDSQEFGMSHELLAHHIYSKPLGGVIGFEVPAADKGLLLLWQPSFPDGADVQATWQIGAVGKTVQYYQ